MMRRLLLASLCAGAFTLPALAEPPVIPAELRPYVPANIGPYFVGFLVSPEQPRPMSRELFIRHRNYMRASSRRASTASPAR